MKFSSVLAVTLAVAATAVTTGCVESLGPNVYSRSEAKQAGEVYYGQVIDVSEATMEGSQSGIGALGGGAMGGAVGSTIGGGSGKVVATVGGAIAGAIAGNAIEKGVTGAKALQITVRLDMNGKDIMVVQGADIRFVPGQRVRVVALPNGTSRILPL